MATLDPPGLAETGAFLAHNLLKAFVPAVRPGYLMGWVHEEICDALDLFLSEVRRKRAPRLMITCPPRSGKTELVSRCFPAYVLGKFPDTAIIATSYADELAAQNNRDVQRIIDSDAYRALYPGTRLWGRDARAAADGSYLRNSSTFEIVNRRGRYRSAGVGGGITGMGGDVLIVDDVLRSHADADSPRIRDTIWDWYTSTFYTRKSPGAGIILIQTRWHMDDLAGRLLERAASGEGDKWRVLNFPALAETDEPRRKAGEALHPERFNRDEYLAIKATIGSRDWAALYQQRPAPKEGAVFLKEWLRRWTPATLPASFDRVLLSWDMTFKDTAGTDFVVGQVWGQKGSDAWLLEQVRGRLGFVATLEAFAAQAARWPQAVEKLVEDRANGPAVMDILKGRVPGLIPVEPDGSKLARAHSVTPFFEAGNVYIPDRSAASWADDLEAELCSFPSAAHDDQVDAMTQALRRMFKERPMRIDDGLLALLGARSRRPPQWPTGAVQ
jgi:predicted phage terminase large subunit-like protein